MAQGRWIPQSIDHVPSAISHQPLAISHSTGFPPPDIRLRHASLGHGFDARNGFAEIRLVDVGAHEGEAEPRACYRRSAETGERVHDQLDATESMKPETLLRQPRWKSRRMRPIAIATLNRFVRNEPRVAAAPEP